MTEPPQRYRDYQSEPDLASRERDPEFRDSTVVMKMRSGSWHAIWQGENSILDEFDGPREDAINWARQRSPRCWVYSEELGDVAPLSAEEDSP